jgi:hypothetical protein
MLICPEADAAEPEGWLVWASRTASSRNSFVKRVWGIEILLLHERLSSFSKQD